MAIKYVCDRCGVESHEEIDSFRFAGNKTGTAVYDLCDGCMNYVFKLIRDTVKGKN